MTEQQSVSQELEAHQIQLPPIFQQFLSEVNRDRKKLLRDKAFSDASQLRSFIGLHLYERFTQLVQLMAGMAMEAYGLAASNTNELRRLHAFTVNELNHLGADLNNNVDLPGVSPEVLDEFQSRLYALGTLLQEKYPEDKDTQTAYNAVAESVSAIIGELMGDEDYDEDDDDDDDSDDDDDDDDDSDDDDSDDDDSDEAEDVDPGELEKAAEEAAKSKPKDKGGDDDA